MSHFALLDAEWPDLVPEARKAELLAHTDPRTSCFYARRVLELAVTWLYRSDRSLKTPYDDSLSALIHTPEFRTLVGQPLLTKAKLIKDLGNRAVHSQKCVVVQDAVTAVRESFISPIGSHEPTGDREGPRLAWYSIPRHCRRHLPFHHKHFHKFRD